MSGLRRICKLYGGMVIQGVKYVWDYAADEPCLESEMPFGSARWRVSERAKYAHLTNTPPPPTQSEEPR